MTYIDVSKKLAQLSTRIKISQENFSHPLPKLSRKAGIFLFFVQKFAFGHVQTCIA